MIKVKIDWQCKAEEWWGAYQQSELKKVLGELSDWTEVSPDQLKELTALPGWEEGSGYARYPLYVSADTLFVCVPLFEGDEQVDVAIHYVDTEDQRQVALAAMRKSDVNDLIIWKGDPDTQSVATGETLSYP